MKVDYESLQNTRFARLNSLRTKVALSLSGIVFAMYYVFLFMVGAYPEVLGYKLGPSAISLGLILGLFILVSCIIFTGIYTFLANKFFDKELEASLDELRKSGILKDEITKEQG